MKKITTVFGIVVLTALIGFTFANCGGGAGSGDGAGGGGTVNPALEGNGVVWDRDDQPGDSSFVFKNGDWYRAGLEGGTWVAVKYGIYNNTTLFTSNTPVFTYTVSGNTLTIKLANGTPYSSCTKKTGQTVNFY